jgi:uncharacterized protein (TIGR02246 family)
MKRFFAPTLILCFFFTNQVVAQDHQAIEARVDQTFKTFWAYDAPGFAANFTETGIVVNPLGMIFCGRDQIREVHTPVFESWGEPSKKVKHKISEKKITRISDQAAIISFIDDVTGDPKAGEGKMAFLFTMVEQNGTWLIQSAQITPVTPPEGSTP